MKKLILIDGNSIMFRAYYATAYPGAKLMQTSQGVYTNALFAFAGMFEKIINGEDVHALVAFDTKEPTKRHEAYEAYKAGRIKMPEELAMQIPLIYQYIALNGVPFYSKPGYEADDIIGTLATEGKQKGYDVQIFSSDRDLLQLVDDKVTVNLLKKGMKEVDTYHPAKLQETYQLTHAQMIDLKALMGDASDNIPGIPGVGEKTAIKLLQTYGTLEALFEQKDAITGKLGENIRTHEDLARLSKQLVTIDTRADIDCHIDDLKIKKTDIKALTDFLAQYELHVLIRRMDTSDEPRSTWKHHPVTQAHELDPLLKPGLSIHFELSEYNYHKADLWGVGISDGDTHYHISPDLALNASSFRTYLADPKMTKNMYDCKAANVFLRRHGIKLEGVAFDLLLAAYLVNSHLGKEEFKRIVSTFGYDDIDYDDDIYGRGAKKGLPEPGLYQRHIAAKAKAIHLLRPELIKQLESQKQLHLLNALELPLSAVLADMEHEGLLIDQAELDRQGKALLERIKHIEKKVHELAGREFNIASPKQLGEVLFEDLKLPYGKKTKTGYSTNVDVLNALVDKHPVIPAIMAYRQLTKLYSTYVEGIRQNVFEDGKVHTIFTQALTTTGRLSSLDPNLQNIPIRTEEGRQIRRIFIASPGHVLLGADYSQIELRVLADMADVKTLIEAFNNHEDIHTKTAQEVFHVDQVSAEQRHAAKAVNFGIIYGISAWSLSDDIGITPKEAQAYIDRYLDIYPEIKDYMERIVAFAKENTYVETIMKRRRYIPELTSPIHAQRAFGERTALNAPIQGSAADILKKAMVDLDRYLKQHRKQSRILLQVHDELILEVPEAEIEDMVTLVPKMMKEAFNLKVELVTSCDTGKTWFDLK
ncbi:MAG: DNA polymerase I [Acholeplasmataceae bacterium]|nr:MAG: DNA polymerase I [Acholeplasmataceae bacterium]